MYKFIFTVLSIVVVADEWEEKREQLEYLKFEPPFTQIDISGSRWLFEALLILIIIFTYRIANRYWRTYGSSAVNTNFVRLTPDQQVTS